jgi:hypothetical protein
MEENGRVYALVALPKGKKMRRYLLVRRLGEPQSRFKGYGENSYTGRAILARPVAASVIMDSVPLHPKK